MERETGRSGRRSTSYRAALAAGVLLACLVPAAALRNRPELRSARALNDQVLRGRDMVIEHGCGDCHGGGANPASEHWLIGAYDSTLEFQIGPFRTRPRNITPDNATGIGRFTERQIFNALRYGLRPEDTPDVEITSTVPGKGNFPLNPHYLAVPMPWPAFRHMPDEDLRAIAAYLKHGVKPVRFKVADSDGPPDFWASAYTPEEIGTNPSQAYPTAREQPPM